MYTSLLSFLACLLSRTPHSRVALAVLSTALKGTSPFRGVKLPGRGAVIYQVFVVFVYVRVCRRVCVHLCSLRFEMESVLSVRVCMCTYF